MKESADILLDNIRNPGIYGHGKIFVTDPFMQGAIAMLKLISEKEGWEDSEKYYFDKFIATYNPIIGSKENPL